MTRTTKQGRAVDSSPGLAALTTSGGYRATASAYAPRRRSRPGQGVTMYGHHTQGAWEVEYDGSITMAGQVVGVLAPDTATKAEATANSHLISAAPDLLEACEAVYQSIDADGLPLQGADLAGLVAMCGAAIAKARGGK